MERSKKLWASLAFVCLIIAGISGYSIYNDLTLYFSTDTTSMEPKSVSPTTAKEAASEEPAAERKQEQPKITLTDPSAGSAPEQKNAAQENREEPKKQKAKKTVFEYKNSSAGSVSLAGSFTKWKSVKMTRKSGVWRTEVYILPGSYLYHFVVDGKKTLAPGKPKTPVGESVTVVAE